MQTEQYDPVKDPRNIKYWLNAWYDKKPEPEPEPEPVKELSDFAKRIIEKGRMMSSNHVTAKRRWKDLSDKEKIDLCVYQSGTNRLRKMLDGKVIRLPVRCNLCEKCYEYNAGKLNDKIHNIIANGEESTPNGQWRMKVVDEDTEAQSLKKHISRNQSGRHIELACEQTGKVEIWSLVEDEPGKDMEKTYGEVANPDEIDGSALYNLNRLNSKKMSVGGAFRKAVVAPKKDTERILIPEIVITDPAQQDQAEKIMERTNYLKIAKTSSDIHHLFLLQFKYIMKKLEEHNIRVSAVKYTYLHATEKEMVEMWNTNVLYWMSINDPYSFREGENMDIVEHLIIPETSSKVN